MVSSETLKTRSEIWQDFKPISKHDPCDNELPFLDIQKFGQYVDAPLMTKLFAKDITQPTMSMKILRKCPPNSVFVSTCMSVYAK